MREKFRKLLSILLAEELKEYDKKDEAVAHFLSGGFISLAVFYMARKKESAWNFSGRFQEFASILIGDASR